MKKILVLILAGILTSCANSSDSLENNFFEEGSLTTVAAVSPQEETITVRSAPIPEIEEPKKEETVDKGDEDMKKTEPEETQQPAKDEEQIQQTEPQQQEEEEKEELPQQVEEPKKQEETKQEEQPQPAETQKEEPKQEEEKVEEKSEKEGPINKTTPVNFNVDTTGYVRVKGSKEYNNCDFIYVTKHYWENVIANRNKLENSRYRLVPVLKIESDSRGYTFIRNEGSEIYGDLDKPMVEEEYAYKCIIYLKDYRYTGTTILHSACLKFASEEVKVRNNYMVIIPFTPVLSLEVRGDFFVTPW